jgi:hypothetical protein
MTLNLMILIDTLLFYLCFCPLIRSLAYGSVSDPDPAFLTVLWRDPVGIGIILVELDRHPGPAYPDPAGSGSGSVFVYVMLNNFLPEYTV